MVDQDNTKCLLLRAKITDRNNKFMTEHLAKLMLAKDNAKEPPSWAKIMSTNNEFMTEWVVKLIRGQT